MVRNTWFAVVLGGSVYAVTVMVLALLASGTSLLVLVGGVLAGPFLGGLAVATFSRYETLRGCLLGAIAAVAIGLVEAIFFTIITSGGLRTLLEDSSEGNPILQILMTLRLLLYFLLYILPLPLTLPLAMLGAFLGYRRERPRTTGDVVVDDEEWRKLLRR